MRPKYVKESLRVTTTYKDKGNSQEKYQAFFQIKHHENDKRVRWLILKTDKDYTTVLGYMIKNDNGSYGPVRNEDFLCNNIYPWLSEILNRCQLGYSTADFKEFILVRNAYIQTKSLQKTLSNEIKTLLTDTRKEPTLLSKNSMFVSKYIAYPGLLPTCGILAKSSGEVLGKPLTDTSLGLKLEEKSETPNTTFTI